MPAGEAIRRDPWFPSFLGDCAPHSWLDPGAARPPLSAALECQRCLTAVEVCCQQRLQRANRWVAGGFQAWRPDLPPDLFGAGVNDAASAPSPVPHCYPLVLLPHDRGGAFPLLPAYEDWRAHLRASPYGDGDMWFATWRVWGGAFDVSGPTWAGMYREAGSVRGVFESQCPDLRQLGPHGTDFADDRDWDDDGWDADEAPWRTDYVSADDGDSDSDVSVDYFDNACSIDETEEEMP